MAVVRRLHRVAEHADDAALAAGGGRLVFPSRGRKLISDMRLPKLVQNHKIAAVPHGFRSSFRDWAAEQSSRRRSRTWCRTRSRPPTRALICSSDVDSSWMTRRTTWLGSAANSSRCACERSAARRDARSVGRRPVRGRTGPFPLPSAVNCWLEIGSRTRREHEKEEVMCSTQLGNYIQMCIR